MKPSLAEQERQADALDAARPRLPSILSVALWYGEQGLRVFPLQPLRKVPYPGSRGCKDASSDGDTIRAWWSRWPNSNLGLATGHGVDVIDIDGITGVKSWSMLLGEAINLPVIIGSVSTPRPGGSHFYVAADRDAGNRAGMAPGVDYRGAGGYVVAPPSINEAGVRYRWRTPLLVEWIVGVRLLCARCGQVMVLIEPGQTTHPSCEET